MTLNSLRPDTPVASHNYAALKLNQLQADLVSTARNWAADEVSAAIAHQLNEPLTALLLYLHDIKTKSEHSVGVERVPDSVRELVERALRETERACGIMERLDHRFEAPMGADVAVARGREVIDLWARTSNRKGREGAPTGPHHFSQHVLTPREHEVLAQIVQGASNKEGGHRLGITRRTFEVHRAHIMAKLGAKNAADLVRRALGEAR
jgi:DNA-binding CsgD family transcriptional regulator